VPKVNIKVTGAMSGLVVYGSLWSLPRVPGDEPVRASVTIGAGDPKTLILPTGRYEYYFAFSNWQEDDEFALVSAHVGDDAPAPTSQKFKTANPGARVFRFLV
jgi:hypothetical protein